MNEPFLQHGMPPLTPNPTESILPNQQALIEPCNSTCEEMIVGSALGSALVQKPPMAFIPDHSSWPSQNSFQQAQICLKLRLPELDTARIFFCLTTEMVRAHLFQLSSPFQCRAISRCQLWITPGMCPPPNSAKDQCGTQFILRQHI